MPAPRQRLSTRIVALFLGLLLLVQLAGFVAIGASLDASARATLAHDLDVGQRIWQRVLAQKSLALTQGTTLLAADFGFRSAVATSDADTLHSVLENHAARIGANVSAWVDRDGSVRAASLDTQGPDTEAELRRLAADMAQRAQGSQVALLGERAMQLVVVPLKAPLTIGWLVLGFALDQALAQDMKTLSGLDLVLLVPGIDGLPRAIVSTLPAAMRSNWTHDDGERRSLGGKLMQLRSVSLGAGAPAQAHVVLLRSVDAALASQRELQWTLLLITAAGVLVFGVGSVFTARRVTTPLRALTAAADRLARGDYGQPVLHQGRHDEIGHLASAFDHMRVSIAGHQAEVHNLAFLDRLTGLPNRASFRNALKGRIGSSEPAGQLAVLMFGLDRFKHVNEVLGYAFGDRLLQAVAGRLAAYGVRGDDLIARLGGDEFAVLLPGADAAGAQALALRVAAALEQPLVLDEQTVDVSAAFGIACWPQHAADADALLSRAEVAMYAAKRKTVPSLVYDPGIDSASAETLSLLSELRRALEHDELRLYLQPKIRLQDAAFIGVEALVRWQHPSRGMVPPLHFIPFAEQTGFVRALTLWMFEACAREIPALQALGVQRVSVNLSTRDLLDLELPQRLQQILQRQGVTATAFCLEITESAIMDEPQRALEILETLSANGFKLSIDDFGTGYSSLAYLKRLPVDELKIDKSFVLAMEQDEDDAKIVRSTIDLAHNLGLSVVAEGIENASLFDLLRDLGCDEGQGFHMCRPLPAAEMAAFAERWRMARQPQPALVESD
ncbi:MAG: EAL domain-containing protein [Rubrivivax sp.]|nr:EAL domain-containing protein [Rubrivivax sp.]